VGGTSIFFNDWQTLGRTLVVGVLAYVTLIVLLRVSGKRTLSKMNAFDFIVTVALGSTLASVLTSKEVTLAQGALAFAVLVGLQFVITWLSVRSRRVSELVKAEPRLVLHRGEFLRVAMRHERVTEEEVRAAARSQGVGALADIDAVVLETDGSFNVIRGGTSGRRSSLDGVQGRPSD
jgi:uncharacterized membrane protein YcaP (DUF421 family)